MSTPFHLHVPDRLVRQMLAHAAAELPNECCGLLAGRILVEDSLGRDSAPIARAEQCFPLVNETASGVEFVSEPRSMFKAMREIQRLSLEILAVYHSHPTSDPIPSAKDRERNYSEHVVNLIISLKNKTPLIRGWWLTDSESRESDWEREPDSP